LKCPFCKKMFNDETLIKQARVRCSCAAMHVLVNKDYYENNFELPELDIKELKDEKKIAEQFFEDKVLFSYFPYTRKFLLKNFTERQVRAIERRLRGKTMTAADRQAIRLVRQRIKRCKHIAGINI